MQALVRYYQDRLQSLDQMIRQPEPARGAESIHHLRVEIKKLRALDDCIHFSFPAYNQQDHFRKLFRTAGKIREVQVERKLFKEVSGNIPGKLNKHLNNRLKEGRKRFGEVWKICRNEQLFLSEKNPAILYLRYLEAEDLIWFIGKLKKRIRKEISHDDMEHLHRARKWVKQLLYLEEASSGSFQEPIFLDFSRRVGDANDVHSGLNYLKNFIQKTGFSLNELIEIKILIESLLLHQQTLLRKVREQTEALKHVL